MLQRLLEREKAVCQILILTVHLKLCWQDIEVIESIVAALQLVADFTKLMWVTADINDGTS